MRRFNNVIPLLLALTILFGANILSNDIIPANVKIRTYNWDANNLETRLIPSIPKKNILFASNSGIDSISAYFSRQYDSLKRSHTIDFVFVDRAGRHQHRQILDWHVCYGYYLILNSRYGFVESISIDTKYFDVELNPPSITHNYIPFDSINQHYRTSCR